MGNGNLNLLNGELFIYLFINEYDSHLRTVTKMATPQ